MSRVLHGVTVMVARPREQAGNLTTLLQDLGARVVSCPAIEIQSLDDTASAEAAIQSLDTVDRLVFISTNAVRYGVPLIRSVAGCWPAHLRVAAVGKKTCDALEAEGVQVDCVPESGFSSEALLSHSMMQQLQDKHVLIVRGVGGRELLAQTLVSRGATVEYIEVYKRVCPKTDISALMQDSDHDKIDIIVVTSTETITNLLRMAGDEGHQRLIETPLVAISQRVAIKARELGFLQAPVVAGQANDEGLVRAVIDWCSDRDTLKNSSMTFFSDEKR